jgi:membrane peptidoglycan carboxypeptidase
LKLASLTILLLAFLVFAGAGAAGSVVYGQLAGEIEGGIARLENAGERESFATTLIMDRDGEVLWEIFGEGKRTFVPLEQIPVEVIQATIAIEDDTFYENIGLDAPSLVAALIANLRNPNDRPVGGSTITQQIVRHIAFDYEERTAVSYERKVKEIILARLMTEKYSKDEILELYLNEIYYGNLAYGIEAAAQTYFGKPATDLSLAEASLLAALPQAPVDLDPLTNLEGAKERQWIVLNLMAEEGFITRDRVEPTYFAPLAFAPQEVSLNAPHFAVYVRQQLEAEFGAEMVANGGLRVTTTLDMDYQRLAERLAREHVAGVGPEHNLTNAALVAMKPGTGEIVAMLGSVDYRDEEIDGNVNIALSPQQPGSAIKPLTYAAALSPPAGNSDPGWTAADIVWDVPVDYPQFDGSIYSPVNYDRTFHGPLRVREALANSYNVPAVLVLQDIGLPRFLDFAAQMGVESFAADAGQYGLSITLGGAELTPLELTGAYVVLANGGQHVPPVSILRVEKADGEVLYEHTPVAGKQVVDARVAFLISDILDDDAARVPAMGTNNPLDLPFPAAAKTGTTNDFRDNWTVGYTPGLVVGVWTGNTDNSEMIDVSGLTGAAPLWSAYMQAVYGDPALQTTLAQEGVPPPAGFAAPAGMEQRPICTILSVTIGATECQLGEQEWFLLAEPVQPPQVEAEPVVTWEELDPGVWRLPAVPLPDLPEEIQIVDTGRAADPVPTACFFPTGTLVSQLPDTARVGVFLEGPRNPESIPAAYAWAAERELAMLPLVACTEELLVAARPERDPRTNAVWRLSSPGNGDRVSGVLSIIGTADFDPDKVQFYKVEIGRGDRPDEWITLGETHNEPVVNGQLEKLVAAAFEPGPYSLRLVLVRWDGNYVGEPDVVTFLIE